MADAPTCLACGYTLTGLRKNRCPECGKAFSLEELQRQQKRDAQLARGCMILNLACIVVTAVTIFLFYPNNVPVGNLLVIAMWTSLPYLLAMAATRLLRASRYAVFVMILTTMLMAGLGLLLYADDFSSGTDFLSGISAVVAPMLQGGLLLLGSVLATAIWFGSRRQ